MSGEKPGLGRAALRLGCADAVGTLQCKRFVIEPVKQTVLARRIDVQAQCRAARRRQGLRLKVDRGLETWRCCGLFSCNVSQCEPISLDAASSLGKCPRDLTILRSLASSHQTRVLQASSKGRTRASSYLNHSDLMRRVMPHPIAKRPVGSCG